MVLANGLVEVSDVSKTFVMGDTEVKALKDISFSVKAGGVLALMGPSGSGKSTLLNLIGALDSPTKGKIFVANKDLYSMSSDERASFRNSMVGFVFQNFNLIPVLTTFENVVLPCQLSQKKVDENDYESRAKDLICRVGLENQMHQKVNRLSGGQMQRVSLARALVNRPSIILADEPTANLDHATAETVLQLMRELSTSEGTTVIVATHDHSVLNYCDRVISLRDGKLVEDSLKAGSDRLFY